MAQKIGHNILHQHPDLPVEIVSEVGAIMLARGSRMAQHRCSDETCTSCVSKGDPLPPEIVARELLDCAQKYVDLVDVPAANRQQL